MKLPRPRPGESIKADHIRQLADAIRSVMIVPSATVRPQRTPNGTALHAAGGGGLAGTSTVLPLECLVTSSTESDSEITVTPGTVLGVMPTIGGTALDAGTAPTISVSNYETRYIVLNISGTPSVTTLDSRDFFHPTMSSITVTITSQNTAPTGSDLVSSTGSFKAHLATFVNGTRTAQNGYGPITGFVQDQLDGSGDGTLLLEYTD